MRKISFKSLIWKEGKHYVSQALNIDVSSFGKTRREAMNNLIEAIELYLENTSKPQIRKVSRPSIVNSMVAYA
jgi:predicted RNase H-like HicB family nuclease